jgi:hypothetical protein
MNTSTNPLLITLVNGFNITDVHPKFSGKQFEECYLIKLPEELQLWLNLKCLKEFLRLMIPRRDK